MPAKAKETEVTPERTPSAVAVTPPKMSGRGKAPIHSPEVIQQIAEAAAKGWTTNNLTYNTQSAAQGALQTVKEAIVEQKLATATSDLAGRVWEAEEGKFVFAIGAKSVVQGK